jgi:YD repeat-containing protein
VQQVLPMGEGLQALKLQKLKQRLSAEGLFDRERKRSLPTQPQIIAVVSSPTAAAWGDIRRTLLSRYPGVLVLLSPATVQGETAPQSIERAIDRVVIDGRAEVLILARGGGAVEDLSCFNSEIVVRAISECSIPVVTGIGHERDESLADLVADVRMATPTAAAAIVVPAQEDLADEHYARVERYSYDGIDRISSIDNTGTVGVPAVKFNYSYDAVGNLVAVNDSINGTNAGITGYSYDLLNRVTGLTQSGTGVQSKRVAMAYNAVNQLTSLSRYSGVNSVVDTNYTYDNNQRLIKLAHVKGANTVASYDYSYDAADKLASTVSSVDGTSNYSYDATNQLTAASHTSQVNEAYSYDANGNRVSGGTVTGVNNQLLSDGTYTYTYDGEGNRTKRTEIATSKVTEYVWDYRNRLASVLFKDAAGIVTKTIEYLYDGNNQRIGKRIDGAVTERYVIDTR